MAESTHDGESIEFYGFLEQIIELQYNSSETYYSPKVVLFRCDWFDTHSKKCRMKDEGFFRSINHGSYWYKVDPFILSTQAIKGILLEGQQAC